MSETGITRLESFMQANGIKPAELSRESAISRQHLLRLRKGIADPTRAVMVAITSACSALAWRSVRMSELFDLGGAPPPSSPQQPSSPRVKVARNACDGAPCIAGTRIPVWTILDSLADGSSERAVLRSFPALKVNDIREAIIFASAVLKRQYRREDKR